MTNQNRARDVSAAGAAERAKALGHGGSMLYDLIWPTRPGLQVQDHHRLVRMVRRLARGPPSHSPAASLVARPMERLSEWLVLRASVAPVDVLAATVSDFEVFESTVRPTPKIALEIESRQLGSFHRPSVPHLHPHPNSRRPGPHPCHRHHPGHHELPCPVRARPFQTAWSERLGRHVTAQDGRQRHQDQRVDLKAKPLRWISGREGERDVA